MVLQSILLKRFLAGTSSNSFLYLNKVTESERVKISSVSFPQKGIILENSLQNLNRLYARDALRRMRIHVVKRERRLKDQLHSVYNRRLLPCVNSNYRLTAVLRSLYQSRKFILLWTTYCGAIGNFRENRPRR